MSPERRGCDAMLDAGVVCVCALEMLWLFNNTSQQIKIENDTQ